ncbi:MAG: hypothetical protein GXP01_03440 [Alphaproteobacteria bacterium]|nr:hypothetical protein [Alphaproteobacteria bacterium]
MTGLVRPLAMAVGFVLFALAIVLSGLSVAWQQTDPSLSLVLNPLNGEARVARILETLNAGPDEVPPGTSASILTGLALAPGDARFYSLLGEVAARRNRFATSRALYRYALETSKTEIHALLNTLDAAVAAGDARESVRLLDMTLRRWPGRWSAVEPLLPQIIANTGGGDALIVALLEKPPWRSQVVGGLLQLPRGVPLVLDMLVAEPPDTSAARQRDINNALARLLSLDLTAEAYRLFLVTLNEAERAVSGYVYNAGFSVPMGEKPFRWRVGRNVMADVSVGSAVQSGSGAGLNIRFFDSPVRPGIVRQRLGLPFGRYRLVVVASANGLRAPKSLYWRIRCEGGAELARLDIPEGTYLQREIEVRLEVGLENCSSQRLDLNTDVNTQSRRARYQGRVLFEQVRLERE